MPNKGLWYSPLAIIQNLRHTLRSGYEPESNPRELLQTADDAGANCLHLGWTPGLAAGDTSNPLLEDPALFAINDGPFTDEHARAIRLVGISSKSGDAGTIGKFGLGLKSVFCVCEAFFYIAGEPPLTPRVHDLINPWSDTGLPVAAVLHPVDAASGARAAQPAGEATGTAVAHASLAFTPQLPCGLDGLGSLQAQAPAPLDGLTPFVVTLLWH